MQAVSAVSFLNKEINTAKKLRQHLYFLMGNLQKRFYLEFHNVFLLNTTLLQQSLLGTIPQLVLRVHRVKNKCKCASGRKMTVSFLVQLRFASCLVAFALSV
jgi:hypothetical protein